jgi:hypothetical protein
MNLDVVTSSELLFMINQLPVSLKNKIPLELRMKLNNEYSKEVYNSFIPDKPFYKQNIREESLEIFNDLVSKYIRSE